MNRRALSLLLIGWGLFQACSPVTSTPDDSQMRILAQPFCMNGDTATLWLRDFFNDELEVEECTTDGPFALEIGNHAIHIRRTGTVERAIHVLTLRAAGLPYALLLDVSSSAEPLPLIPVSNSDQKLIFEAPGADSVHAFWNHFQLQVVRNGDRYTVGIPLFAKDLARSHIRAIAFTQHQRSMLMEVPLRKGKVIASSDQLKHTDWKHGIAHQVPELVPSGLAGYNRQIDAGFYDTLPFNMIVLPTLGHRAEARNGRAMSLTHVDPDLGDAEDLSGLLNLAHKKGLSVIMQIDPWHLSVDNALVLAHPQWFDDLNGSVVQAHLDQKSCAEFVADSLMYWIEQYELDGLLLKGPAAPPAFRTALRTRVDGFTAEHGRPILLLESAQHGAVLMANGAHCNTGAPGLGPSVRFAACGMVGGLLAEPVESAIAQPLYIWPIDSAFGRSALSALGQRKESMASAHGSWELIQDDDRLHVERRRYFDQYLESVTNRSSEAIYYEDLNGKHHEIPSQGNRVLNYTLN